MPTELRPVNSQTNIITKTFQLLGDFAHQISLLGSAPRPCWESSDTQIPSLYSHPFAEPTHFITLAHHGKCLANLVDDVAASNLEVNLLVY